MENKRSLFKFYKSYFDVASELSDKDRLSFYDALMNKQFYGTEPNLKGMSNFAYISQKHSIDAQVKGWEDKMEIKLSENNPTAPPTAPPAIQLKEKEKEKEEEKNITCFSFVDFWSVYPNKTNKSEAEKKYNKLSETDRQLIKDSIQSFINFKPFKDYNYPMPNTYINQKRWNDYISNEPKQIDFSQNENNGLIDLSKAFSK